MTNVILSILLVLAIIYIVPFLAHNIKREGVLA